MARNSEAPGEHRRVELHDLHALSSAASGELVRRLVDTSLRLHAFRDSNALYKALVDEAVHLSAPQRVLLVLSDGDGLRIARSVVPQHEDARALLHAITPWLSHAHQTHAVSLRHGPEGADPIDQRSCVIAPLIARGQPVGYLYADIEGAVGRFDDADRDLLGMLALHAAMALDNIRVAEGLERTAAERSAEVEVINSIQQGMAGSLDFRGVIELVGDKLRTVFGSDNLSITWWDELSQTAHLPYVVQHGERVQAGAAQTRSDGPVHACVVCKSPGADQQPCRDGCVGSASTGRVWHPASLR